MHVDGDFQVKLVGAGLGQLIGLSVVLFFSLISTAKSQGCPGQTGPHVWPGIVKSLHAGSLGKVKVVVTPRFDFVPFVDSNGTPSVKIVESGVISFVTPIDSVISAGIEQRMHGNFSESCEHSKTGISAWRSANAPLTFSARVTATLRQCTKINYPCFEKGICSGDNIQDISSGQLDGSFSLTPVIAGETSIALRADLVSSNQTSGGGDIANLLRNVGIIKAMQDLRVFSFSQDINPPIGEVLAELSMPVFDVARPDYFYLPKLESANWVALMSDGVVQQYGLAYTRSDSKKMATGCAFSRCIRSNVDIQDTANCVLDKDEPDRRQAMPGENTATGSGVGMVYNGCAGGENVQILICRGNNGEQGSIRFTLAPGWNQQLRIESGSTFRYNCGGAVSLDCPSAGAFVPLIKVDK
jgi:hypothetical protein